MKNMSALKRSFQQTKTRRWWVRKDNTDWPGLETLWEGQYSTFLFRNVCSDKEKQNKGDKKTNKLEVTNLNIQKVRLNRNAHSGPQITTEAQQEEKRCVIVEKENSQRRLNQTQANLQAQYYSGQFNCHVLLR